MYWSCSEDFTQQGPAHQGAEGMVAAAAGQRGARHSDTEIGGRGLVKGHPNIAWQLIRVLALSDFLRFLGLLSCISLQSVLC